MTNDQSARNAAEAGKANGSATIAIDQIPVMLKPAVDVTEAEYRRVRIQRAWLWLVTGMGIIIGMYLLLEFGIMLVPIPFGMGVFSTPVVLGIVSHLVAAIMFRDAKKMATSRMKMYPELKAFLRGRELEDRRVATKKPNLG